MRPHPTKPSTLVALLLSLALPVAAGAQSDSWAVRSPSAKTSLIELYTSEGCSSCPPADLWLSQRVRDPRLWHEWVPVAFHVDYWDYIGWADRFAAPAFAERQRAHAAANAMASVYTPGFFVDGREWRGWFTRPQLPPRPSVEAGVLALRLADSSLRAEFEPSTAPQRALELHHAVLGFGLETRVTAGENAHRTLRHDFVVLQYGRTPLERRDDRYRALARLAPLAAAPRRALAAWVTPRGEPRPLQAAGGWLDAP